MKRHLIFILVMLFLAKASDGVSSAVRFEAPEAVYGLDQAFRPAAADGSALLWSYFRQAAPASSLLKEDISTKGLWIDARFDMGYAYLGVSFIDAPATADKIEGNFSRTFGYGYSPTWKIDLMARYQMMKADENALAVSGQSKNYGSGLDIRAVYKIYDALTYNVGAAYLWPSDHFKGTSTPAQVKNIYLLMHWLDLSF